MLRPIFQLSAVLISSILFGCVTATSTKGRDGAENQLISCPEIGKCYKKANEVCSGPYRLADPEADPKKLHGLTGNRYEVLVKCVSAINQEQ